MAVINQINLVNNVGESETYDVETKITPALQTFFENQNKLSDPESLELQNVGNVRAFVAEYDGFITLTASSGGVAANFTFYVNETQFAKGTAPGVTSVITQTSVTCAVNKGDTCRITGTGSYSASARYFKSRLYSN